MGSISRAEYRRQKNQKETVYKLTKSQIDAIKRQATEDVYKNLQGIDLQIRTEYERQLLEKVSENEKMLKDQRFRDFNLMIAASLHAMHVAFGWKVYKGDQYQRYLMALMDMLNSDELDFVKEKRWVKKNLGIELKEVFE